MVWMKEEVAEGCGDQTSASGAYHLTRYSSNSSRNPSRKGGQVQVRSTFKTLISTLQSVSRQMPTLPGELIDTIIDWSHANSPSSLAACALVCRQWLPRSRHHHFASIRLTRNRSKDTVKTFLYLVGSPLVTFISSIREAKLHHRSAYGTPVLSAGDIVALLSKFGIHLSRLTIDCHFNQLGMQSGQNNLTSLTHLRLLFSGEVPQDKLLFYLSTFPSLESLSMGLYGAYSQTGMGWISASLEQHINVPRLPPTLSELNVCNLRVLRLFASLDTSAQFTSLILRDMNHFSDVSRCLSGSQISPAMVSLTLENCDLEEGLNFPRLGALRYLHIRHRYDQVPIVTMVALACSFDHPSSSRPLEMIDLTIDDAHEIDTKAMDIMMASWRQVDAVLAGADSHLRWPNLRRLAVRGLGWIGTLPEDISLALHQNMPLCVARGILVIL